MPVQQGRAVFRPAASARYDALAIAFHWLMLVLVAVAYASIELRGFADKGTAARMVVMELHKWSGALVLALAVPWLLWRLMRGAPAQQGYSRLGRLPGVIMNGLLYVFLFAQPILGILMMNADGRLLEVPGLGASLPALIAPDAALKDLLGGIHQTVGKAFYLIIGLHAMAALFHHYMLSDDSLRRILPRK